MHARSHNVTAMRVALVSDIHGNLAALEAVVADIRRRGADQIVCLGDNISGPLLPRGTAQYRMNSGWPILAGNHERQVFANEPGKGGPSDGYAHSLLTNGEFAWLRSLPPQLNTPDAQYAIVERSRGEWTDEHDAIPYDNVPMAELARARDRPDWEQSLLRGYVR